MTLSDFATPIVPSIKWGRSIPPADVEQIREWIKSRQLETDDPSPHPTESMWWRVDGTIDKSRWPYKCGVDARRAAKLGKEVKPHGLQPGTDTHRHWQAGWDAGG